MVQPAQTVNPFKLLVLVAIVAVIAIVVFTSLGDRAGDPVVHALIESETDCASLQQEFDDNMGFVEANPGTDLAEDAFAYAETADSRMAEVGCYS